ncbi:hypothetical protein ABEB36_004244 [Hypothenemus hampei]|uniref:endo-polygalacturonase n=1 Tax=Hypothenemus hampei TaxID=57062 RepID=A0ABD1F2P6_HYPHA
MRKILLIFHLALIVLTVQSEDSSCIATEHNQVEGILKNCTNIVIENVIVPAGNELTLNIRDGSTITFRGNITFEHQFWQGPLLKINGSNFILRGEEGSFLNGNGPLYWDGKGTWGSTHKPKFVKINAINATMENVRLHNCPVVCVMIRGSDRLTIRNWFIDVLDGDKGVAPLDKYGHNTDGFTIGNTNHLLIENTKVYNQDDCVSITSGENITVRNLFCHGSHGISINGEGEVLKDVLITDSLITNAENGIHVKTHVGSPPGLLQNITYKDVTILDSKFYGINIQQNYQSLPEGEPIDGPPENSVQIHVLNFINVYGNVQNGAVPVFILCADGGCFDWKWDKVEILGAIPNNCTGYSPDGFTC